MKKRMICILGSIVLVGLGFLPGLAQEVLEARFGHGAPTFHGQSRGVDAFAAYVKEKTNGAVTIRTFPMSQLGSEASMVEQVQAGSLEIAAIGTATLEKLVPQAAVTDLPFVFPDLKTAHAVFDDPEVQAVIFDCLSAKRLTAVGWIENGLRDITNSKREIRKPEDLKGLKIRVMTSPIYIDAFKALAASPVEMPFTEIVNALQKGTIDGEENPLLTSILIRATEVNKFVTMTGHILGEGIIVVSPEFWKKLSPDQQVIFREAGVVCIRVNRAVNAALMNKLPPVHKPAQETAAGTRKGNAQPPTGESVAEYCKRNNVTVVELTPEERGRFKKAMEPVWNKYRQQIGADLFDFFLAKVEEHSKKK